MKRRSLLAAARQELMHGIAAFRQAPIIQPPMIPTIAVGMSWMGYSDHSTLGRIARNCSVGDSRNGTQRDAKSQRGKACHNCETHVLFLTHFGGKPMADQIVPRLQLIYLRQAT
jgi:hypothetical protein